MPYMRAAILAALLVTTAGAASAPRPAHAQAAAPDVVMLHSGGMLRGTIAESVPGEYVVILLVTGETRRVDAAEVKYAGPATGAPGQAAPPPPAAPPPVAPPPAATREVPMARLTLEAADPEQQLTFYTKTGEAVASAWGYYSGAMTVRAQSFKKLCTAPCRVEIPESRETLALALGDRAPVPVPGAVDLRGDLTVRGKYKDDSGIRVGGWVLFGVGTAVGTGVMLVPLLGDNSSGDVNLTPLFIGTGIVIGSAITSLIMILNADNPSVETLPTP